MDIKEIRWESVEWIHLAQDRDWSWALVSTATNLWVSGGGGVPGYLNDSNLLKGDADPWNR
jgi:hypothetical protein